MKAGTLIFLIIVILIAFGFVLSDSLQTKQDVQSLMNRINDLNTKLGQAQTQLVTCQDQGEKDAQTIQALQQKAEDLQAEIKDLNGQLASLNNELAILKAQQSLFDLLSENPVLLTGALLTQVAASAMKFSKKLGIQWPGSGTNREKNDYVKLSLEERELLISTRRNRRNKK